MAGSYKVVVHCPLFQTVFFFSEWNAGGGARVCRHAVHLEELLQSHSSGTQTHVTFNAVTVLRCEVYSQMHAQFGLLAHIQFYYQVCHGAEEELNKNGLEYRLSSFIEVCECCCQHSKDCVKPCLCLVFFLLRYALCLKRIWTLFFDCFRSKRYDWNDPVQQHDCPALTAGKRLIIHNLSSESFRFNDALLCISGEVQRAAKPSGDLWEDRGGAGTWGHQAHEIHVLPGERGINLFELYSLLINPQMSRLFIKQQLTYLLRSKLVLRHLASTWL